MLVAAFWANQAFFSNSHKGSGHLSYSFFWVNLNLDICMCFADDSHTVGLIANTRNITLFAAMVNTG